MVSIHDRQMVCSFVKAYFFCLISLMGLFIVVDLFMNLEDFSTNRKDIESVARYVVTYYSFKSFQIFDRLCESVILLAAMFTVAWMQRNNELLPLLSAGVSTRRAVLPVFVCAFLMMGLVALNQEFGLPNIDVFMLENRQNPDGSREVEVKGAFDMNGVHVTGRSAVRKNSLIKDFVAVIPANVGRNALTTLQAKEAYFVPRADGAELSGGWLLKETKPAELPGWAGEDVLLPRGAGSYFLKATDVDLDTVIRVKNWFTYLPTWRLLQELERPGNTQPTSLAVTFHGRLTRPLIGIILVLLGLSVILRDQNRNVFLSAGLCMILCALFFATIFACQFLGKDDVISPALSAWLPVIVFGPVSLVMYDAVHT